MRDISLIEASTGYVICIEPCYQYHLLLYLLSFLALPVLLG
jgi:hypothetical protein